MYNNITILAKQGDVDSPAITYEHVFRQRARATGNTSSSCPLPLQREVAPAKPFPFAALGAFLGPVAKRIHEIVKAPDSICGQSILAAAAFVVQAHADILIDGRTHPFSLFMLTAAESGDRKSAVDSIVLKPIRDYERALAKNNVHEKQQYKNKLDAWKKQRELLIRELKSEDLEIALNKMPQEPKRPLEPYLLLEEPSYEGLVKLFDIGQPSMGLFSDEGGRMFGGHAMSKDNMLKTACGLSSLWDGKPITRIRGGDENLLLFGRRLSCHLMIQEVVLANILKNDLLVGQGLTARCLIVAPLSNAGDRSYNSVDISQDPLIQRFYQHISSLLNQPFPYADNNNEKELQPRLLELSPDAKKAWVHFHDEIDQALRPDGMLRGVRRAANKSAEQALRIAGVLTLVEDFDAKYIISSVMERAIELTRFYLNEANRISDLSSLEPDLELAQAVLEWMRKKVREEGGIWKTFSLQEIYQRAGPRGVRNKQMAQKVMRILEDHKIVEPCGQEKLLWRLIEPLSV